ncbi:MAG: hypothetical protein U5Q44_11870 [Dehalococcoidia bacterium]|nr:hypothetical protein [Dehalococcoidia bacterium]
MTGLIAISPERHQEGARLLDRVGQLGYMFIAIGTGWFDAADLPPS